MCPVIPWRDFVSGDTGKRIQSAAIGSSQSRHGVSRNTSGTFEQQWGLDATGNWKTFKQDNDGNGTWELNQTRTANKANEITGITNSVGVAWATPTEALEIWRAGVVNLLMCQFESRKIRALTYPARLSTCLDPSKDAYTSGTLTEAWHYY